MNTLQTIANNDQMTLGSAQNKQKTPPNQPTAHFGGAPHENHPNTVVHAVQGNIAKPARAVRPGNLARQPGAACPNERQLTHSVNDFANSKRRIIYEFDQQVDTNIFRNQIAVDIFCMPCIGRFYCGSAVCKFYSKWRDFFKFLALLWAGFSCIDVERFDSKTCISKYP
jgi:hypothetical protein